MHCTFRSVLTLFSLLLSPLAAQTLQLADGKVLLANVETADGEGLRVRRLDNGGVLDLRWDHLSPASALAVKKAYDLAGDTHDELLVRAEEVEYVLNGQKQTIIGKVVEQSGDHLVVQQKGVPFRVPRAELRTIRKVDAPVTQIYTKEEYYAMRAAELQPGTSADKHILLAEDLIKVRDYDRAAEHLQKAKELGNSANPQHLESMLQRLARYKEAAKERELLDQIQAARSRGQLVDFEKGKKLIAQYQKDFPQSKLKSDFDLEKKRFDDARTRYLSEQIADQWRRSIQIIADKKVADNATTLQSAREYAENKMTDDIVARLAQQLRLEAAEIKELWAGRAKFAVGKRTEHFTYSLGSWVLGEEKIVKGTQIGKAKEQKQPTADDQNARDVERLARLFREAMERRTTAQNQQGGPKKLTDEDWWRQASRPDRTGWLRAYYAEYGGQLVVTYQSVSECVSCYGAGTTPEMGGDGKIVHTECFLCQGTKWLRSFKAY